MSDRYVLNAENEPVPCEDLMAWASWIEETGRTVAKDIIGDSTISTVFFGIDYSFGSGPLLLFETMVFGGSLARKTGRYSNWEQAVSGHKAMVERVKGQLK